MIEATLFLVMILGKICHFINEGAIYLALDITFIAKTCFVFFISTFHTFKNTENLWKIKDKNLAETTVTHCVKKVEIVLGNSWEIKGIRGEKWKMKRYLRQCRSPGNENCNFPFFPIAIVFNYSFIINIKWVVSGSSLIYLRSIKNEFDSNSLQLPKYFNFPRSISIENQNR